MQIFWFLKSRVKTRRKSSDLLFPLPHEACVSLAETWSRACEWHWLLSPSNVVSRVRRMNEGNARRARYWMGDRLRLGIPSRYVTSQLGQFSLASPRGRLIEYQLWLWGKGGNVTSAGWQVTLCDPMWHVSSRSGVATLRTAIHLFLTYLLQSCRCVSSGAGIRYTLDIW